MAIAFEDPEALDVNNKIFETIYHAAMETSIEIAQKEGPYSSFHGSPLSQGKFQYDLWDVKPYTTRYDWDKLRSDVMKYGARNSLLVAPMPTASTSQILGNNESFEPFTSNIYTRRVLSGEFICVNKHLVRDLINLNLWTSEIKNLIVAGNGSVQGISKIPERIQKIYKTIWEIPQKTLINLALGRGPYICQSQSLNLYLANPQHGKISSMHFYTWKNGLKTGQYYFRSRPARDAIKFTVNVDMLLKAADKGQSNQMLEVLTTDNQANLNRKRKTAVTNTPSFIKAQEIKPSLIKVVPAVTVTDTEMVP